MNEMKHLAREYGKEAKISNRIKTLVASWEEKNCGESIRLHNNTIKYSQSAFMIELVHKFN